MKCQRRPRSAHSAALASASWWRFSPTSVTPRSASSRTSEAGKNLVTTTSVTSSGSRPAPTQAAAIRRRTASRLAAELVAAAHEAAIRISPARRPDSGAVASVGVEVDGPRGCSATASTHATPASASWARTPAPRSTEGVPQDVVARLAGTDRRHLVAHLRRGPRSSGRTRAARARPSTSGGPEVAHPGDGRGHDPGHQPRPAAVAAADHPGPRVGEQHRHAVGARAPSA